MGVLLGDILDLDNLRSMVTQKYIKRIESGDGRVLYDYTSSAQFDRVWNNETRLCRGLVTDDHDNLLARPFPKFWNLSDHANPALPPVPNEPFDISDKLDGSLIIAYRYNSQLAANTRGSFTSTQALAAAKWLRSPTFAGFVPEQGVTHLFEWISPDNRIVIDYGARRECVLLDVIDNHTGRSISPTNDLFARPEVIAASDYHALPARDNAEGYVVRFQSGFRVKVKHPRYVQLHKLLSGLTEHRVWEILSSGSTIDDILEIVPDETYQWLRDVEATLLARFHTICTEANTEASRIKDRAGADRKAFAAEATKSEYRSLLFLLFDGKSCSSLAWKLIEPRCGANTGRPIEEAC